MGKDAVYRFGDFVLDTAERQLRRAGRPVRLNSRYFDALALLVREEGRLVDKERFFTEVWRGIPVGDEALTQCMKTLRRCLDDDASSPRFIETVPKHGYRFVAPVERMEADGPDKAAPAAPVTRAHGHTSVLGTALAGALGGAGAGSFGGLFYGTAIAFGPTAPEVGAASIFMLLMALNVLVGAIGGFGVSLGWTAARTLAQRGGTWHVAGAALGGMAVGGITSILGLDAFNLLLGEAPDRITGAAEGAVLGAAVGLALMLSRNPKPQNLLAAGLICAAAGAGIVLLGGTLMAGSLDGLAASVAGTDLPLDRIDPFFAGVSFDGWLEILLAALEGLLFGAGVVLAINLLGRSWTD